MRKILIIAFILFLITTLSVITFISGISEQSSSYVSSNTEFSIVNLLKGKDVSYMNMGLKFLTLMGMIYILMKTYKHVPVIRDIFGAKNEK